MKLETYMCEADLTVGQLATKVGRDRSTVAKWLRGRTRPDWEALATLEAVTGGLVTAKDFVRQAEAAE